VTISRLHFRAIFCLLLPPHHSATHESSTLETYRACKMKLSNSTLALLGLTATALGSAVPRAALPECTEGNNNTTACGSLYSYGNDVFQCANLRWDWVERCSDPDVHCDNGACVPKQPECIEGEKECLTVLNRGYDGINICKNGD
jgi:hypothetical protein